MVQDPRHLKGPGPDTFPSLQAVEELLESLDLEKSSYHMGLSRV